MLDVPRSPYCGCSDTALLTAVYDAQSRRLRTCVQGEEMVKASQSSTSFGMPPLRRGSDQSGVEVVTRGLRNHKQSGPRPVLLWHRRPRALRPNRRNQRLHGCRRGDDRAPWEGFTLPSRDAGPRGGSYGRTNPGCGETYVSFEPRCSRCGVPHAPTATDAPAPHRRGEELHVLLDGEACCVLRRRRLRRLRLSTPDRSDRPGSATRDLGPDAASGRTLTVGGDRHAHLQGP